MLKFCYNPFSKHFLECGYNDHALTLYKAGKQKIYHEYIRGIIIEDVLFLRVYYPFNMPDDITSNQLKKASYGLLKANFRAIKDILPESFNNVIFNAENESFEKFGIKYI